MKRQKDQRCVRDEDLDAYIDGRRNSARPCKQSLEMKILTYNLTTQYSSTDSIASDRQWIDNGSWYCPTESVTLTVSGIVYTQITGAVELNNKFNEIRINNYE